MAREDWPRAANHIGGGVAGPSVQAGAIYGDVHLHHVGTGAPACHHVGAGAPTRPPAWWADRPELPTEVRFLLRAQVQAAQELPYRLPGARRPSLATVHVRQDLGGVEEPPSEQHRPTPILDGRGRLVDLPATPLARPAVRPPTRTVREALDGDDHLLVTGGPGQGKSTLSLRLAADVAARWSAPDDPAPHADDPAPHADDAAPHADRAGLRAGGGDSRADGTAPHLDGAERRADGADPLAEPVVPVRVAARELAARLDLPFSRALADAVRAEYGSLLPSAVDARTLGERVAGCRWLLLVDGLDEVADTVERDRLVAVLAAWAVDESPYRVVLTTRPIEGAALAPLQRVGAARYELQPFDAEALLRFAESWFADDRERAHRFVRQVRAAHLDELVRVPLLATIAAIIFEQRGGRPLPDNQYELYESYLKYLRSAHPAGPGPFDHCRDALVEHLGRVRLEADTSLVEAAHAWAARHLADLTGEWREELTAYLASVGPLTRRGDDLCFLHHSFAEHVAATAEARLLPDRFDPAHADFARLLHAARSGERGRYARRVLLHHTRLHPAAADDLVRWLHDGDPESHLVAARLLASHVPAGEEVVAAFLATVRGWAMTTQYPAAKILARTGRAAHHPGLAEWLLDLLRDGAAPWASRVEAATALATRLRGAHEHEARALLRSVVDDAGVPAAHRLAAAEALSDCGGAERAASERGLRAVLADPTATASQHRTAAVVLAGFGPTARADAVAALEQLLDDPDTPGADLAEAATGLVEIGVEFHDRAAEVFRTILSTRTSTRAGLDEAARGLASLGAAQAAEAATALETLIADPRIRVTERARLGGALADLGAEHRATSGRMLAELAVRPGLSGHDRRDLAAALARCGPAFRPHAAGVLRLLLADGAATANELVWAADELADLGPDHHDEAARAFQALVDDPLVDGYERVAALRHLVRLGEPHRTPALTALRATLADPHAEPDQRRYAASELARIGPEFHAEVIAVLVDIVSRPHDADTVALAWRVLMRLDNRFRREGAAALLDLAAGPGADEHAASGHAVQLFNGDADDPDAAARVLTAAVRDRSRHPRVRINAVQSLVQLGRSYHRAAVDGAVALLRSGTAAVLPWLVRFPELGDGLRTELVDELRAVALRPEATESTVCQVERVMRELDHCGDPAITDAIRVIVADESAPATVRGEAALAMADVAPKQLAEAVDVVLRLHEDGFAPFWLRRVRRLPARGGDLASGVRRLLVDPDARRAVREASADLLAAVRPDLVGDALGELRSQAADDHLDALARSSALRGLAALDPGAVDQAVAFHRALLDDETRPMAQRCTVAHRLAILDRSTGRVVLSALRRFVVAPTSTAEERLTALTWLDSLHPHRSGEITRLAAALIREPSVDSRTRCQVVRHLHGHVRGEVERLLLADHVAPVRHRVPATDGYGYPPLPVETEAVLRDVLAAAETTPAERVEAAVALGRLSRRFMPEVEALLAGFEAWEELAGFEGRWRRRALDGVRRAFADGTRSWREWNRAAHLLADLFTTPPEPVLDHLRDLARTASGRVRLHARQALGKVDGRDAVRAVRDDERENPAIRRAAAVSLREYAVADRAAGAALLRVLATDPAGRPALRRQAAEDLLEFGDRGREWGVAALRTLVVDDTLPATTRARAASALGHGRPDLRREVVRFLRDLRPDIPAHRVLVLRALGAFEPEESSLALRVMADDRAHGPVVRMRCAEGMADLWRDHREAAAIVAREIAHDAAVPRHVRRRAARDLARWSELCRAEARDLLVALRD
ncbi:hypothetical protein [Saccharothrix australiensis]|uniref:hypothetical protein n=1 Tax=Saccharothrix australiensis TaxID=2072 RepID=UPI000EB5A89A|nr:hypothetical protein [Saccharothrix australiensis]